MKHMLYRLFTSYAIFQILSCSLYVFQVFFFLYLTISYIVSHKHIIIEIRDYFFIVIDIELILYEYFSIDEQTKKAYRLYCVAAHTTVKYLLIVTFI